MEQTGFGGGVAPGGLKNTDEIKILICYLLRAVKKPLSFDAINEILQHDGLCNYFDFANSLHELLITGHVDLKKEGDTEYYKVTSLGSGTAATFERRLPLTVRERAVDAGIKLLARINRESDTRVEITSNPSGGYNVSCSILDMDDRLMTVTLLVADSAQAAAIRDHFRESPDTVYEGMLAIMTGDVKSAASLVNKANEKRTETKP